MPGNQAGAAQCKAGGNCPELTTILQRLDAGDTRMSSIESALQENTALTQQVAQNTAGFVAFADDLAAGTRFLCRCVKGMQFVLRDVIDPYWKPVLVVGLFIYWMTHGHTLPDWATSILGNFLG